MKTKYLSELFNNSNLIENDIEIKSLASDSRNVGENCIFFCIKGLTTDGHNYIDKAVENGATVIVHSEDVPKINGITYIKVDNVVSALTKVCNRFYDNPSTKLKIYAVTGTNGKTTTSYIMESLLSHFEKTSYLGTVGLKKDGILHELNHMTTPDCIMLNSILSELVDESCRSLCMEISSHSLEQHRVDILDVDVAIFTNLTHEHLDYHKTMDAYMSAKRRLFGMLDKNKVAVLNIDDKYFSEILRGCNCKVLTYGTNPDSDFFIHDIKLSINRTKFKLNVDNKEYEVNTNLVSEINTYNLVAAMAALYSQGHSMNDIIKYAQNITMDIGRFQIVNDDRLNIIVDFAHTPDGFVKIFEFAKQITPSENNIISVFGSAGRRDVTKRPILGKIADEYCDKVIICEDDYRDEDPNFISEQILSGMNDKNKANIIIDRYEAIRHALTTANEGDTVLILSKGLDQYIPKNGKEVYWMGDHIACEKILNEIRK